MATALSLGRAAARTTRRRLPVTATLTVAVLVLGAASGALWTPLAGEPLADAVGYGPASVHTGHWWGLVTGAFFADHPVAYVALLLGVVLGGGFAEWPAWSSTSSPSGERWPWSSALPGTGGTGPPASRTTATWA